MTEGSGILEFAASFALMMLVVGAAARWALRNGLKERFESRRTSGRR